MLYVVERTDERRIAVDSENLKRTNLSHELLAHAWKMIPKARFERSKHLRVSLDMGMVVGTAEVVRAPEIKPAETTTFARRRGLVQRWPCRVRDLGMRKPETRYVTMVADWHENQQLWILRSAYCGQYVYPQPWDFEALHRSRLRLDNVLSFWCRAAFLYVSKEFEMMSDESWADIIDTAADRYTHEMRLRAGYYEARRLWHNVEQEREDAIQARAAQRAVFHQRG